ncbi:MAG: SIMPL domain-containing protein [Candidatus Dojkabacteria bacterium]
MLKNIDSKYIALAVVCVTLLICTLLISNGNFYIKNIGTAVDQNGQLTNTISVSGDGKVFAKPNMVLLTVSSSELANTSKEALANASSKIQQAVLVAQNNGVSNDDIQTSNLNVNPEYDYNSGNPVFKGQRATVSVEIKIKGVDNNASKATTIIDGVSAIDKIQIGGISFDIEDKTSLFTQARKLAFDKAKQKADELSGLSGVKLVKPVSVSDNSTDVKTPSPITNVAFAQDSAASSVGSALSSGQLEITLNVNVIWGIE